MRKREPYNPVMDRLWRWIAAFFLFLLGGAISWEPVTATPAPTTTPEPTAVSESGFSIFLHPNAPLYAGDWVSVELAGSTVSAGDTVTVRLDALQGAPIGQATFYSDPTDGRIETSLPWIWNTTGAPGTHILYFTVAPANSTSGGETLLTEPVTILPDASRPENEVGAVWKSASSACCTFHYISGTETERDLPGLIDQTEAALADLETRFGPAKEQVPIDLLSKVVGQGGFTTDEVAISYLDRSYPAIDYSAVIEHELSHWMLAQALPKNKSEPLFLNEGMAVYLVGGHYHHGEPLQAEAAALLADGEYIPFAGLVDTFYLQQHEIGYVEAGAFMQYLAGTYGWDRVLAMLLDPADTAEPEAALNSMLRAHFGKGAAEMEADWNASLRALPADPTAEQAVDFSIRFYGAVREYQQLFDPSAYFVHMWIPSLSHARERNIVTDYLRHPNSPDAAGLEMLFETAAELTNDGNFRAANATLADIQSVLDFAANSQASPFSVSSLADQYRALAAAALGLGDDPVAATLFGSRALLTFHYAGRIDKEIQFWDLQNGNWVPAR